MVSEANEPGSESGKRSDDRRGVPEGTPLAAPGSFAAAAMIYSDSLLDHVFRPSIASSSKVEFSPPALLNDPLYAPPALTVRPQPPSAIVIGPSVSTCRSTLQPTRARRTSIVTAAMFRAVRSRRRARGMLGTGPHV